MKFEVNALGKEALVNKYLKEPTEMKIYSFVRCMTTGEVYLLGGSEIEYDAIEEGGQKIGSSWQNKTKRMVSGRTHGVKLSGFYLHSHK